MRFEVRAIRSGHAVFEVEAEDYESAALAVHNGEGVEVSSGNGDWTVVSVARIVEE